MGRSTYRFEALGILGRYGNAVEVQGGSILPLEVCRDEEQIRQHLVGARECCEGSWVQSPLGGGYATTNRGDVVWLPGRQLSPGRG